MGLIDSSITLWQKAVRLDPSNQQFQNNLNFVKKKR
jgi:transketolase